MTDRRGLLGFERNVGGIDRYARAVLAVVFLVIGVAALVSSRPALGVGAFVASAGLGFNAITGFCGINAVLGVDTCSWDGATER
jgi:hypothetical protein